MRPCNVYGYEDHFLDHWRRVHKYCGTFYPVTDDLSALR